MSKEHKVTTIAEAKTQSQSGAMTLSGAWAPTPAQAAANQECQHPRQSRVQAHEAFEPYGLN